MRAAVLLMGLLSGVALVAQSPPDSEAPSSSTVLERFLARPAESLTRYRATRHLEARNQRFKRHGWMDVVTELSPEQGFTYTVIEEGGSDYIRRKALRSILEGERDIIKDGTAARSALTAANYDLVEGEEIEPGLTRLLVRPRRRDITLIEGELVVAVVDGDLVRLTGRLSKSPSFWTKRVDIVRRYGRIAGVRVPLAVESTAQVRIVGTSTLSMTYSYETVNGIKVTSGSSRKPQDHVMVQQVVRLAPPRRALLREND
ncbi:MAG: hypothetical protein ACRD2A_12920 [Vicinamibacterales bacterium]